MDLPELTPVSSAQEHFEDDGGVRDTEGRMIGLGFDNAPDEGPLLPSASGDGISRQTRADEPADLEPAVIRDEPETLGFNEEGVVEEARINRKVSC